MLPLQHHSLSVAHHRSVWFVINLVSKFVGGAFQTPIPVQVKILYMTLQENNRRIPHDATQRGALKASGPCIAETQVRRRVHMDAITVWEHVWTTLVGTHAFYSPVLTVMDDASNLLEPVGEIPVNDTLTMVVALTEECPKAVFAQPGYCKPDQRGSGRSQLCRAFSCGRDTYTHGASQPSTA